MTATQEPGPVEQFEALRRTSSFVFLLYYRGHWCPFCVAHLKELVAISDEIKAGGGVVVAATAEAPEHLSAVRASTGFADPIIVDPEHVLANHLKSKGLLDVAISDSQVYRLRGYKNGLAQPALLVLGQDGTVMYRWAIVPSLMNIGGATDRPVLADVWKRIQKQLRGEAEGAAEHIATTGAFHLLKQKVWG